jgi:hypothetical protein
VVRNSPQEIFERSKTQLLNVKSKECNKDSAYYEDTDESFSPDHESLSKRILNILDPDQSVSQSYCYTYQYVPDETSVDKCLVEDPNVDKDISVEQDLDSDSNVPITKCPVQSVIDVSSSAVNDTSKSDVPAVDDIQDEEQGQIHEEKLKLETDASKISPSGQQQTSSKALTEQNCGDIESTDNNPRGSSADESNVEKSPSKSATPLPLCDWLLPVPVCAYYANLLQEGDTADNTKNIIPDNIVLLSKEITDNCVPLLLYLAEVQHIDDWLRYNLEPGYRVLQTTDLSVSGYAQSTHGVIVQLFITVLAVSTITAAYVFSCYLVEFILRVKFSHYDPDRKSFSCTIICITESYCLKYCSWYFRLAVITFFLLHHFQFRLDTNFVEN